MMTTAVHADEIYKIADTFDTKKSEKIRNRVKSI